MTRPDGLYGGIPEDVYHGDKESLSSSGARLLLSTSPAQFWWQRNNPPTPKTVYDVGHACHKMVLGEGGQLVVVDAENWRTKAAQERAKWARANGKIPLLKAQVDEAQRMAGKVYEHPVAAALLAQGDAELSGWWTDAETGVRLRFRPDFVSRLVTGKGRTLVVDYKTSTTADPKAFAKRAAEYGYHAQGVWYLDGLAATADVVDALFVLVVQQKDPPYLVSVCQFEPEDMARGKSLNRKAIRLYAGCLDSGTWPGYDGISVLSLPTWARREMDEENTVEGEM